MCRESADQGKGPGEGRGLTLLYKLYRYVHRQRVWLLNHFGPMMGIVVTFLVSLQVCKINGYGF